MNRDSSDARQSGHVPDFRGAAPEDSLFARIARAFVRHPFLRPRSGAGRPHLVAV